MRYLSLFSGIEAASVAWGPLGWEPVAFCEIDAFPSAVLARRFPGVPNLGDITKVDWSNYAKGKRKPDVVVGGSPCQSFSVAGRREGLAGESGLMFEYVRAVRSVMPRCFVWENVPGALSSENGEAFRQLLEEMDALGYGMAWRVLDAQFFGVAQRRERVFLVGCLGDPRRACEILFEPEGLRWDTPSSREKRKELAAGAGRGAAGRGGMTKSKTLQVRCGCEGGGKGALVQDDMSATLSTSQTQTVFAPKAYGIDHVITTGGSCTAQGPCVYDEVEATLKAAGVHSVAAPAYQIAGNVIGRATENGGHQLGVVNPDEGGAFTLTTADRHAVAYRDAPVCLADDNAKAACDVDMCGALKVGGSAPVVSDIVNALCAADAKGAGNQVVNDGKVVAFAQNTRDEVRYVGGDGSMVGALAADAGVKQQSYVHGGYTVRRLTPRECERLQGFPDDWTLVPYRGKPADECPDGPRYKALGNSMAVPVMRWIGERIERAEAMGC